MRRCTAEFAGTFFLVFAGTGAIAVDAASGGRVSHLGIGLVFGLAVAAMIHATGHISGAHLNPAVTLGFALARHFAPPAVAPYWLAQLAGAAAASLVLRLLLGDAGALGLTQPAAVLGSGRSWLVEWLLSFFLMFVIMAVATDVRTVGAGAAQAIGGTVALEAVFAGPLTGASMNPARSFGPALATGAWGDLWIYVTAPAAGAAAAALLYAWLRGPDHAVAGRAPKSAGRGRIT